ncbi:39S ribosomal protein L46, mitochondrial-like [Acanthaster planci]|uniref:Large ribosomal subunit protein mL46 n=1 Tax=Acanthaster planci TaxID=133434 RepID=A0A8B7XKR9_ACAPL|nr:39S ribosomal protein L46, mitochondrial-like [Acanthaster planci]
MAAPMVMIFRRISLKFVSAGVLKVSGPTVQKLHPHCIRKYTTPRRQSSTLPAEGSRSPKWELMSAVCLERYPVVSQDRQDIEEEYWNLLKTTELENSLLSDHEMQVIQDKEKMVKKQSGAIEDDDDTELVSALDLEDQYTEELNQFIPASRKSDIDDLRSIQRKLMDKLVLLVKCRVGDQSLWMMPQETRQDGETMRQAADRVLFSQCGMHEMWRSRLFGNAPCAFYKYVYPPAVQEESKCKGAKVFFYKARLLSGDIQINQNIIKDYAWVTLSEMDKYLTPSYLDTVRKFILPVSIPDEQV